MAKKLSKKEIADTIEEFFKDIVHKTPKEIKKIRKLAMSRNIPLKEKRKLFCKKCFSVYKTPKIRIKKGMKIVECENCGFVARWKLK